MVLSNNIAALLGFACEAVLWGAFPPLRVRVRLRFAHGTSIAGIYTVLFIASVVLLLRRVRTRSMNVPIFIANFLLFASCTAHFALELKHFYAALVSPPGRMLHASGMIDARDLKGTVGVQGFADETAELVGADLLISLSDFLGDLVLLYRCWVIWGKNFWVVLLPLLTAAAGFGECYIHTAVPRSSMNAILGPSQAA